MPTFAQAPPPAGAGGQCLCGTPGAPRGAAARPNLGAAERLFWVAPWGRSAASGTERDPFATPHAARDAARSALAHMAGDVLIVLRGGRYELSAPLTLSASDSGQNGWRVRYVAAPGEAPVLSGGRLIGAGAWVPVSGRPWLWQAPLPSGVLSARQLYVDGVRARRVRAVPPGGAGWTQTTSGYRFSGAVNPLADWRNPGAIEFIYNLSWMQYRLPVSAVDASTITMADAGGMPWSAAKTMSGATFAPVPLASAGAPAYVEHAYELLSASTVGCFWVDGAASPPQIYYVPRAGEDLASATCIVPALDQAIVVAGTPAAPVHDLVIEGLGIAECGWLGPNTTGHAEFFGNLYVASLADASPPYKFWFTKTPGAVAVRTGGRLAISGCTLQRLGAGALTIDDGTTDSVVASCIISDVSANAIDLSAPQDAHSATPCARNTISGNTISDVCTEYQGGAAILCWQTDGTTIQHNHISDLPYIGIILGAGGSGPGAPIALPTVRQKERVHANLIENVMQVLVDGGAIYTNAEAAGLEEHANLVQGVRPYTPGGLLYMDDVSAHVTWRNNVVLTGGGPSPLNFNNNTGPDLVRLNFTDAARTSGNAGAGPPALQLNRLIGAGAPAPASVTGSAGTRTPPAPLCSAPLGLHVSAEAPASAAVLLSWTAPGQGAASVAFYEVWASGTRDAGLLGTTTGLSFTYADLAPGAGYLFSVRAVDGAGGVSAPSALLAYSAPSSVVPRSTYGSGWE